MAQTPKRTEDENRPADLAVQDSVGGMAKRLTSPGHLAELVHRGVLCVQQQGWQQLGRDIAFRVGLALHRDHWQHRADRPTRKQLKQQRGTPLWGAEQAPVISVITPLYNTPLPFLKQLLRCLQQQTYPAWQLVLVDASDAEHPEVGALAQRWAAREARICYHKLEHNGGIAANTTAGFTLATGDFITLLDHDDLLYPNALYEVAQEIRDTGADFVYTDEIVLSENLKKLGGYHFKVDYAPDYLRGCNYITHLAVFSRPLLTAVGPEERSEFDGSQDYDLILRLTEKAACIRHIPRVLYIWRGHAGSTAENLLETKPYAIEAGTRAIDAHLQRIGLAGKAEPVPGAPGAYRVRYALTAHPKISVIIPNKDHVEDLERCLDSLFCHAGYNDFEVLVVENNSTEPATEAYYAALPKKHPGCRVVRYEGSFNFSAICNFGVRQCEGEQILLLNNDIEALSENFLAELLSYSQRSDVGCVGAKLYYPDDTIQHGGILMGINGTAGHSHKGHPRDAVGDLYRLVTAQDYQAVTGACLMVKRSLYEQCGGLDEQAFAVAYNDVDLCLKLRAIGLLNVFTPFAECIHYESKSRGLDESGPNAARYAAEKENFIRKYRAQIEAEDPYYNPHFNRLFENYGLK